MLSLPPPTSSNSASDSSSTRATGSGSTMVLAAPLLSTKCTEKATGRGLGSIFDIAALGSFKARDRNSGSVIERFLISSRVLSASTCVHVAIGQFLLARRGCPATELDDNSPRHLRVLPLL